MNARHVATLRRMARTLELRLAEPSAVRDPGIRKRLRDEWNALHVAINALLEVRV